MATVRFADARHLLEVGLQVLFYATPVIYPRSMLESSQAAGWFRWNPLSLYLQLLREPLIDGRVPAADTLLASALIALCITLTAAVFLARGQRRLVFYL
jgi:ABC-type polysaccharide/polyol phosphate export permease